MIDYNHNYFQGSTSFLKKVTIIEKKPQKTSNGFRELSRFFEFEKWEHV